MEIVGANIKKQRLKLGSTLSELTQKLDVSPSFLSQVENGKTSPSLSVAKKIADALNTTIGVLIGEEKVLQPNHIFIKKMKEKS